MISANVSAFSIGKAVGRGGGVLATLQWNNTAGNNIIALQSGGVIRFAVPSNNPSPTGSWQYKLSSGGTWYIFGHTVIDLGSAIIRISDGSTFRYIIRSANWGVGNTNYIQRFYPGTDVAPNASNSGGETAAINNNAGNFNGYFY